jgi:FkbM family methyltransferase
VEEVAVALRDDVRFDSRSGLYWPDNESKERCFKYMLDRVCDVDYLVKFTKTKGVVVQAGGFVGMWPIRLARSFERVYTFEPIPQLYNALLFNVQNYRNIRSKNCALSGARDGVELEFHRSGCSRVAEGAPVFPSISIDSLDLPRCDALYLDVEKHELEVLAGAEKTIKNFAPTIMLETHPDCADAQDKWMKEHGYKLVAKVHGDRVFTRG